MGAGGAGVRAGPYVGDGGAEVGEGGAGVGPKPPPAGDTSAMSDDKYWFPETKPWR